MEMDKDKIRYIMKLSDRCKLEGVELPEKKECYIHKDNSSFRCSTCVLFTQLNKLRDEFLNFQVPEPREALDEEKLRYILNERNPLGIRLNEQGAEAIIKVLSQKFGKVKES